MDVTGMLDRMENTVNRNTLRMEKNAKENRDWQKMMSDTAHQREVKDLQAAGLNPVLSAGGSGASTPSGATADVDESLTSALAGIAQSSISSSASIAAASIAASAQRDAMAMQMTMQREKLAWDEKHPNNPWQLISGNLNNLGIPPNEIIGRILGNPSGPANGSARSVGGNFVQFLKWLPSWAKKYYK
nr:MAG: DNA pilot protein [Microvirus Sku115]